MFPPRNLENCFHPFKIDFGIKKKHLSNILLESISCINFIKISHKSDIYLKIDLY